MLWTPDEPLPSRVDDAVDIEADGARVVYRVDADEVYLLNATAAMIYEQLDGTRVLSELVADLSAMFGVPADEIMSDVSTLLDSFDQRGLLARSKAAQRRRDRHGPAGWLVDPPTSCGIPRRLSWAGAFTVAVGTVRIGMQTTREMDTALRRAMAPIMVDGAPERVSLSLRPGADDDEFHVLYWGGCPAVRTRDPRRLAASLIAHLGCHRAPEGRLRTFLTAVQRRDGSIVLFQPMRGAVPLIERRLHADGAIVSDWPYADIELDEGGRPVLAVSEPELPAEASAAIVDLLEALPPGASEPRISAGRHPIARVAVLDGWTMGDALYVMFTQLPKRSTAGLHGVNRLLASVPTVAVTGEPAVTVSAALGEI